MIRKVSSSGRVARVIVFINIYVLMRKRHSANCFRWNVYEVIKFLRVSTENKTIYDHARPGFVRINIVVVVVFLLYCLCLCLSAPVSAVSLSLSLSLAEVFPENRTLICKLSIAFKDEVSFLDSSLFCAHFQ